MLSTCGLMITVMKQWSVWVVAGNEEEWGSLESHKQRLNSLFLSSPQPSHYKNKMIFLGPGYLGATTLEDSRLRHFSETRKLFGAVAVIPGEMRFSLRKDLGARWESPGL